MARPAGFEPTTPWFVAKYSIQLSYGRYFLEYLPASILIINLMLGIISNPSVKT
jgi:hypothetical protein